MDKKENIWDYFDDTVEYPKDIAYNPIPWNVVWTYISSTFLNGFVNYVNPIACYVVNRYTKEDDKLDFNNLLESGERFNGTKKELIDNIISGNYKPYHTDLSCFEDDIIILAEIKDDRNNEKGVNKFMFFWFDMDVSDCSIGRIKTEDYKEFVVESLENWLTKEFKENKNHEENHEDENGFHKLPLSFLKGWLKF